MAEDKVPRLPILWFLENELWAHYIIHAIFNKLVSADIFVGALCRFFAQILPYAFIVKELTKISREERLGTSVANCFFFDFAVFAVTMPQQCVGILAIGSDIEMVGFGYFPDLQIPI